jgi:hypothetical protein
VNYANLGFPALWDDVNTKATFSFWYKNPDVSVYGAYTLTKYTYYSGDGINRSLYILIGSSGYLRFFVGSTASGYKYWNTATGLITSDDTWYLFNFAIDLDTATLEVYINGVEVTTTAITSGTPPSTFEYSSSLELSLGRLRNSDGSYAGIKYSYIDQLSIHNTILSQDQISTLYNSGNGLAYANW